MANAMMALERAEAGFEEYLTKYGGIEALDKAAAEKLPDELLDNIVAYMDFPSMGRWARTNKANRDAV